ncbi:MAG: hypothetical protein ACI4BA_08140 [Prevotella sp.]
MKKIYIKPAMKVYEIETPQLLAGSETGTAGVSFYSNGAPGDGNEDMW